MVGHTLTVVPIAGLARRAGAYFVDVALIFSAFAVSQSLLLPLRTRLFGTRWMASGPRLEAYTFLTISLPAWCYCALGESSTWQATPGKRLFGLRVTGVAGERIHVGRALLRAGVKFLPWESAHLALNLPTPLLIDPESGTFQWGRGEFRRTMLLPYVLLGLWAATMAWTPRRQGVHDLVAGTIVRTA